MEAKHKEYVYENYYMGYFEITNQMIDKLAEEFGKVYKNIIFDQERNDVVFNEWCDFEGTKEFKYILETEMRKDL